MGGVKVLGSSGDLLRLRSGSQNARHAAAKLGVKIIRELGLSGKEIDELSKGSPRGFYSNIIDIGHKAIGPLLTQLDSQGELGKTLKKEFENIREVDQLFTGFDAVSTHKVADLTLSVYPGLHKLEQMDQIFPEQAERIAEVKLSLENNLATPSGQPSPIFLPEDHPGWSSEHPDIRNIRGGIRGAVQNAKEEIMEILKLVDEQHGTGTMEKIKNIVVIGIGANDMYLKDLPLLINQPFIIPQDPGTKRNIYSTKRNLYSIFEPSQLNELPAFDPSQMDECSAAVTAENTLFIAISRGGETQETIKSLYFAKKQNRLKYLVGYANKGLLKDFVEREKGILRSLASHIGGRYMWAKGLIVLVPFGLTASDKAWEEYTGAMIECDEKYWPVGNDTTIFDLSSHLYHFTRAYNISGLFMCSNSPVLDAGLRQPLQLHNEAVGKITNGMIAFGPGMEMLPFAHAGADGILGAAISALLYGGFIFDTSCDDYSSLTVEDLLPGEKNHAGLTQELLKIACVFPNQAKFIYAGGPNFMIAMNGVNFRNLATLTFFYQNLMYPYLIMNGTNPDSNPNVAMVRKTTAEMLYRLIKGRKQGKQPMDIIQEEIPKVMKG